MEITYLSMKAYYFSSRRLQLLIEVARVFQRDSQFSIIRQLSTLKKKSESVKSPFQKMFHQCWTFFVFVLWCCVVFCFVFIASLNSVSFWVISTSQRLRKLIEFWDQFISLRLCSLCSSFFWYVLFYLE